MSPIPTVHSMAEHQRKILVASRRLTLQSQRAKAREFVGQQVNGASPSIAEYDVVTNFQLVRLHDAQGIACRRYRLCRTSISTCWSNLVLP